jgi:dihydrofolate synthase/folylpolyglutamate synthase
LSRLALAGWLERQQSAHSRGIDLELSRVATVAARLGVGRPACPVITVGGTNGKGSVSTFAAGLLSSAGLRTGLFTSPHLVRYNERIRIDGAEAVDDELVDAFERIEQARGDVTLTYFEYNTLAALLVFAERATEAIVLEVGLGGRLDATNIVDADVAVICSVGFDHRDWLGDTLDAIGREKAGICRPGRPAVLGSADMPASVFASIEACGARALIAEQDFSWAVDGAEWSYRGPRLGLAGLAWPALAGSVQFRNAATALAAVEALPARIALDVRRVSQALFEARLPGRFQIVQGPVEWIIDVAHNEPAARVLAGHLADRPHDGRTIGVVGILGDKDAPAIKAALAGAFDHWVLCTLSDPRGQSAEALAARLGLPRDAVSLAGSVQEGCAIAREQARPGDRVVACGSFLVAGAALQWLGLY